MNKILAVVVILLFIGVAVAPSINANVSKERMIGVPVTEHKEDGTKETTIVKISWSDLMVLKTKLQNTKEPEEILLLYKDYGLVPLDASLSKMRNGMHRLAEKLGISKEKMMFLHKSPKLSEDVVYGLGIDFFSKVNIVGFPSLNLPIGLSFITGIINWIIMMILIETELYIAIPSFDFLQFYFLPFIGWLETWDDTWENLNLQMQSLPLICLFIGFVGFSIQLPIFSVIGGALGFSVATIALGWKHQ